MFFGTGAGGGGPLSGAVTLFFGSWWYLGRSDEFCRMLRECAKYPVAIRCVWGGGASYIVL